MQRKQHQQLKGNLLHTTLSPVIVIALVLIATVIVVTTVVSVNNQSITSKITDPFRQEVYLPGNHESVAIDKQLKRSRFTGTALIVKNNQVVLNRGYGYANLDTHQLNTPRSLYQIASLQKSLTATLIMQQVEQGKLQMNTTLSQFYPRIPDAKHITIRQLLTMTSGLKESDINENVSSEQENIEFDAIHTQLLPSKTWTYQSINFRLLAGILMKITNKSYTSLVDNFFNKQLKLNVVDYKHFKDNVYSTTSYTGKKVSNISQQNYAQETGTGNVAMSAGMLYQYYKLLIDNKILKKQVLADMWTHPYNSAYASGLYHYEDYHYGHGFLGGFEPTVFLTKDGKSCVILLSNNHKFGDSWKPLTKQIFMQVTNINVK